MEPRDSCSRSRQPDESTLDKKEWKSLNLTSTKNIKQHCGGQDCLGEGGAGHVGGPTDDGGVGQEVYKVVEGQDDGQGGGWRKRWSYPTSL